MVSMKTKALVLGRVDDLVLTSAVGKRRIESASQQEVAHRLSIMVLHARFYTP